MEATITIKATPREFDVLRAALKAEYDRALGVVNDRHTDFAIRAAERKLTVELNDLMHKLG